MKAKELGQACGGAVGEYLQHPYFRDWRQIEEGAERAVAAHVFTSKDYAKEVAVRLRGYGYLAKVHERTIKVERLDVPVYVVVVRRSI